VYRLAVARAISITGGTAAFTALMFTVYERTGHDPLWLSAALLVTFGLHGVLGWFAGALGDRFDRRKVLILSDVAGAAVYLTMAPVSDAGWLLLFGFLAAVAESPFISSSSAAVPALVDDPSQIDRANSLVSAGTSVGIFLGPAIGGVLVDAVGPGAVFGGNAVTFGVSAALVWSIRRPFSEARASGSDEHRGVLAGLRFVRSDPVLRRIAISFTVMVLFIGLVMVADLPLVQVFYDRPSDVSRAYGFLIAAWGLGSVLGSIAGRVVNARNELRLLVAVNVGFALAMALMGVSPVYWPVLLFVLTNGVCDAVSFVAVRGIQQRRSPDAVRSRVMASTDALMNLGVAAGYIVAGPLVAWLGPRLVYVAAGVGALIATGVLLPLWWLPPPADGVVVDPSAPDVDPVPRYTSAEELEVAPTPGGARTRVD
jgi:MFS family permease